MRSSDHQSIHPSETVNVIVPVGAVGAGVREADVMRGLQMGAHAIACDAGSTDSGPAYLATGKSKYSRDAVKSDLAVLMRAQATSGIPLLIGSCGTSGCDVSVDWMYDIACEIAAENAIAPRIARLYSEQEPALMADASKDGRVTPLPPIDSTNPALFLECDHIVALMGCEPYIEAVRAGADVVLGGRTTDAAVIAAVPIMLGAGEGPAWHAGKTAECGGQCTTRSREGGVIVRVGRDHFEVEPLSPANACTPRTVAAHMLYENSDPFRLIEPGGILDVERCTYTALDERVVRVTGSVFEPGPYTMKLEGAAAGRFQTIMLVGIRDPNVLGEVDRFMSQMLDYLRARVVTSMGLHDEEFDISLRAYGWNAVEIARSEKHAPAPSEIGLLFVATADSQELATRIAKTCNPAFFHMPLEAEQELPSYAFPFSPAETERGPVFEFKLNHVIHVRHHSELVRSVLSPKLEASHATAA